MMIRTVLCPVDFSPLSARQTASAAEICSRFGARLILENNIDPAPPVTLGVGWMWSEAHETASLEHEAVAKKRLRELSATVPKPVRVEGVLTRGPIATVILKVARELPADLVILGSHGRSTPEHASLTEQVVSRSACPVLASQGDPVRFGEGAEIVVAADLTAASKAAMRYAFAIAEKLPVRLALLHVATPFEEDSASDSAARLLRAAIPPSLAARTDVVIGHGDTGAAMLDVARSRGSTAILLGLHPHGIVREHLSELARKILHESRCPVWFLPAHGS